MHFASSRELRIMLALAGAALWSSCGGSSHSSMTSSSSSGSNVQAVSINGGPNGNYANGVFTNVTICAPGSSTCQTINNVLVDTGSFGLRVLASALTVSLPQQNDARGSAVVECAQFVLSTTWGPVRTADVKLAAEAANSIPIQVIGDPAFSMVPASCSSHGKPQQTLGALGANGILGIGFFIQDCGNACAVSGAGNPGVYYACPSSGCQVIAQPGAKQVQNPVASFSTDNNGSLLQLPSVSGSTSSANGSLIFGIGTQSNNGLGTAEVFRPNHSGNLTTTFHSASYPGFLDSGSNAYFFLTSSASGIPPCSSSEHGFYCPSSPDNLSALNRGSNGTSNTVSFTIDSAATLFANGGDNVFPNLGGPSAGNFDWGLPFFLGRNVFTAIETRNTPAGTGPYWAY
jgi:hypothetical protein